MSGSSTIHAEIDIFSAFFQAVEPLEILSIRDLVRMGVQAREQFASDVIERSLRLSNQALSDDDLSTAKHAMREGVMDALRQLDLYYDLEVVGPELKKCQSVARSNAVSIAMKMTVH